MLHIRIRPVTWGIVRFDLWVSRFYPLKSTSRRKNFSSYKHESPLTHNRCGTIDILHIISTIKLPIQGRLRCVQTPWCETIDILHIIRAIKLSSQGGLRYVWSKESHSQSRRTSASENPVDLDPYLVHYYCEQELDPSRQVLSALTHGLHGFTL